MKKILTLVALVGAMTMQAQDGSRWGVRTGLNYNLSPITLDDAVATGQSLVEGDMQDNGYHIGLFGRQMLGDQLYVSTSLIYGKNQHFLHGLDANGDLYFERMDNNFAQLDASLGLRLIKTVRAEGGVHLQSDLGQSNFSNTFDASTAGFNLGVGVDLWKLSFDLTYYSSFMEHSGDWNGIPLAYDRTQLLFSIGVKL